MINRVDDNCENCLRNLCYLLENLDLQCFFLKQCENVVYLSFDASHYLWSFPSVGHFLRKPPNLNSTLIHIVPLKRKLHFYMFWKFTWRKFHNETLGYYFMVLDICSYIISGKLILILLLSSKLVFLPICIVEMYVTANRSQGGVIKKLLYINI